MNDPLNEARWVKLFWLMAKVTNAPSLSAAEKGQLVVDAAARLGQDIVLEEFQSMVDLAWSEAS